MNIKWEGDRATSVENLKNILKHILPPQADADLLIERCLSLAPILKANLVNWDCFKAFIQGTINRHGSIRPKYDLVKPIPLHATYINYKSEG